MISSIYSDSPNSYNKAINYSNKITIKDKLIIFYLKKIINIASKVPPGKNIIYTKLFFDTKSDSNNFIYKYKSPSCCQRFPSKMGYKL